MDDDDQSPVITWLAVIVAIVCIATLLTLIAACFITTISWVSGY